MTPRDVIRRWIGAQFCIESVSFWHTLMIQPGLPLSPGGSDFYRIEYDSGGSGFLSAQEARGDRSGDVHRHRGGILLSLSGGPQSWDATLPASSASGGGGMGGREEGLEVERNKWSSYYCLLRTAVGQTCLLHAKSFISLEIPPQTSASQEGSISKARYIWLSEAT